MNIKLTYKEKIKAQKKIEKNQERLLRIENKKKLYWEHYEYLKKKPLIFRNLFVNKFFTTNIIYPDYKSNNDLKLFISNLYIFYVDKLYNALNDNDINLLIDVLIFIFNNYEIDYNDFEICKWLKFKSHYIDKYINNDLASLSLVIYNLYWWNKKWNIYYNIALEYQINYENYLNKLKDETNDLEISDKIYEELWYDFDLPNKYDIPIKHFYSSDKKFLS